MAVKQGEPSPAALKAAARIELRRLAAALKTAKPGESVHGARRQIKRLRSLLRLLRTPMGEDAFAAANGALRDAADALAGQRRAEALVTAAGQLGGRKRSHMVWLELAEAHRNAHASEVPAQSGPKTARRCIVTAAAIIRRLQLKPSAAPHIGEAFLDTYRKARKRLARGFASGDASDLHTARKHVIHHIHHLDQLRAYLAHPGNRLAALDKLREALGDLNDLDELGQLASSGETAPPDAAARAMARRWTMLVKRAEKAAGRLFRQKPKAFRKRIGALWSPKRG